MLEHRYRPSSVWFASTGAAFVLTTTAAMAQGTPSETAGEPEQLGDITVTGVPLPGSPLSQSTNVDTLDSQAMDRSGAANLGDALSGLAGVNNIGTGNTVGKPVIRGLSGERVTILSDGVSLDHQQYGVRHMPAYDPFLAGRVEVARGASSVLYGSSALGGAVNMISPEIRYDTPVTGKLLTRYYSNNGQLDTGIKASGGQGQFGYALGLMRRDAGDVTTPNEPTFFPPPPAPERQDEPAYTGELPFTDFEQVTGDIAVGFRGEDVGEWKLRYKRWEDDHNFLLPPPAVPPASEAGGVGQFIDDQQLTLSGRVDAAGITWKPKFKWQNNRRRSNAPGNARSAGFDDTLDVEFDQYTARLVGEHGPFLGLDGGSVGLEYRHKTQDSRGSTQLSPGGEVTNAAVFAFEEKSFGPLLLQGGLRLDHHRLEAEASRTASPAASVVNADSESWQVATGSLGGIYSITDELSLAANLGRGFRAPTLFERYADGVHGGVAAVQRGDDSLDPETSLEADASIRWFDDTTSFKLTAYRNRIDDYIALRGTGQTAANGLRILRYGQVDAELRGIELSLDHQLNPWLAVNTAAEVIDGERRDTGDDLPLLPSDNLRVGADFTPAGHGWFSEPRAGIDVRYHASKDAAPDDPFAQFDNAPFGTASTDDYTLVDLSFGFSPTYRGRSVDVDVEVRNLLDKDYRGFLDTYKGYGLSPGRDVRLTVQIPFGS